MNEQELGKEIAKLLNLSTDEIKQSTLYRLQSARRAALENYQPTLEIIHSGNSTSLLGGHDQHLNTGRLLLLLIVLFAFAVVSATYWQFLEKNRSTTNDTTILVDDLSTEAYIDNKHESDDDLSIDAYIDNVRKLVDDLSTDTRIDNERELEDDLSTDTRIDNELELGDDISTDTRIDNELELNDDISTDTRIDNERELEDDLSTDARIDNERELDDDLSTDARIDNELDKWLDSNK